MKDEEMKGAGFWSFILHPFTFILDNGLEK